MWNRNKQMRDEDSLRKAGSCSRGIDKGQECSEEVCPGSRCWNCISRTGKEARGVGGGGG